jgi:hypothetical protein
MKILFKLLPLLVVVCIFTSCNIDKDVLSSEIANTIITKSNLQTIADNIVKDNTISNANIELFVNAITRLGNYPDSLVGKSVGQLIQEQKNFAYKRDQDALVSASARIALFLNHKFNYAGLIFQDDDPKNKLNNIIFDVTNNSGKEIIKLTGILQFYTTAGEIVRAYDIETASPIPPTSSDKKPTRMGMPFKHEDGNIRDSLIRYSKDLSAIWTPTLIEFKDGTSIKDIATANLTQQ